MNSSIIITRGLEKYFSLPTFSIISPVFLLSQMFLSSSAPAVAHVAAPYLVLLQTVFLIKREFQK